MGDSAVRLAASLAWAVVIAINGMKVFDANLTVLPNAQPGVLEMWRLVYAVVAVLLYSVLVVTAYFYERILGSLYAIRQAPDIASAPSVSYRTLGIRQTSMVYLLALVQCLVAAGLSYFPTFFFSRPTNLEALFGFVLFVLWVGLSLFHGIYSPVKSR